jgi:photosystem II stability/assembly factor-like uncharacterized protein
MLACALNTKGAEYAGWTVGVASTNGQPTILRSTDSGTSWTCQGTNGQVAAVPMFGVTAVDPYTAWVVGGADPAGYATIYHTSNGGGTWNRMGATAQMPEVGLQKVATFGDNRIWAVGFGVILHSRDGGATWTNQVPSDYATNLFQGVATPDGVNVWVTGNTVGDYATILKSTNGGASWTRQRGSADDVQLLDHILDISTVDTNTAWAIGGTQRGVNWAVLATTNGGSTWTRQSYGNGDGNGIHAVDASTIWAVSDNNTTWSADGGTNWQVTHSPTDTMGISAVDSQRAWAVTAGQFPAIQWTTNGGTTWLTQTQLNGGSLPSLFTVSFAPTPFELPILRLTQSSPSQVTLSWPTNTAGFVLETTLTLPNATWITVTNVVVMGSNNLFHLDVATTNAQQFFRLQRP